MSNLGCPFQAVSPGATEPRPLHAKSSQAASPASRRGRAARQPARSILARLGVEARQVAEAPGGGQEAALHVPARVKLVAT